MPANIDIKTEVDRASARSNELERMIHNHKPIPLRDDRSTLVAGLWALMVDYHRSVLLLVRPDVSLCGGGFALARPMVEALLRIHVAAGGTDSQVERIKKDEFRTDFKGARMT